MLSQPFFAGKKGLAKHLKNVLNCAQRSSHTTDKTSKQEFNCESAQETRNRSSGEKVSYVCEQCSKTFALLASMKAHTYCVHGNNSKDRRYTCGECAKVFSNRKSLVEHVLTHTQEKPFKCSICEDTFRSRANKKKHEKSHFKNGNLINEKQHKNQKMTQEDKKIPAPSYTCSLCSKVLKTPAAVAAHTAYHTKGFTCRICDKGFRTTKELREHENKHNGVKPYACRVCAKPFSDTSARSAHEKTHTRERAFACHICPKTYTVSKALRNHIRSAHIKNEDD